MDIYSLSDDSFLLSNILKKNIPSLLKINKELKVLEIGIGSGIQIKTLKSLGVLKKNILGVDINSDAVSYCKKLGFNCIKSNLFEKVKEKYDLIIFNPPYLPENKDEPKNSQTATTGGKKGGEIINRFLEESKKYLKKNGKIFLLVSNLTKGIELKNWKKKVIGKKKLFFEELMVWELLEY